MRLKAELFAQKNKGHVIKLERRGVDIKVWARRTRSSAARPTRSTARTPGGGHARARIDVTALGVGGVGNIGRASAAAIKQIGAKDWDEL